jgi:MraZ protein
VTSLTGQSVRIYPMPVWAEVERRIAQMPSTHPARQRFLDRVNFYGQVAEIDQQGRVLIQPRLRDSALMTGEVDVLGQQDYLEVWNHDRFEARLIAEPFTDDDAKALSDFGI